MRLRKPCEHGRYEKHYDSYIHHDCPGGESITEPGIDPRTLSEALGHIDRHIKLDPRAPGARELLIAIDAAKAYLEVLVIDDLSRMD